MLHSVAISNSFSPSLNEPNQSGQKKKKKTRQCGEIERNEEEWEKDKCVSSLMPVNAALTATRGSAPLMSRTSITFHWQQTWSHLAIRYHSPRLTLTDSTIVKMFSTLGFFLFIFFMFCSPEATFSITDLFSQQGMTSGFSWASLHQQWLEPSSHHHHS